MFAVNMLNKMKNNKFQGHFCVSFRLKITQMTERNQVVDQKAVLMETSIYRKIPHETKNVHSQA